MKPHGISSGIHWCEEEKVMKYDIELCMKVSEKQWIESLRNGTVCFNPIEVFIKKAEKNGNNEQGDRYGRHFC